ncbi:MAG TPA: ankyrin repeat domain-containing protein [Planctomycetaceae bacterium]|nr:ankyrin repeat domain-containing protein [Planctomycetaceae bacterium]
MKHLLLTTIAAVVLVGCGPSVDIWDAAGFGNIEAVKKHLADGADVNAMSSGGGTPLHNAAMGGHKEIVELLIAEGAEVNAKDNLGGTPLHNAALGGRKEVAELLIAEGADAVKKRCRESNYTIAWLGTGKTRTSANPTRTRTPWSK